MRNRQTKLACGQAGFTLIELLVVIAVVGILAAAVISGINPNQRFKEARDSQRKTIVGTLATATEACYTKNANGTYTSPTDCTSLAVLSSQGYVRSDYTTYDVTSGVLTVPVFTATAGCVSTKLEAPTGSNTNWTWRASSGTAVETSGGCP